MRKNDTKVNKHSINIVNNLKTSFGGLKELKIIQYLMRRVFKKKNNDAYFYNLAQEIRKKAKRGGRPGTLEILKATPIKAAQHILDIGMGTGEATEYFLNEGLKVTATGVHFKNFGIIKETFPIIGVSLVECLIDNMPFKDEIFDACWMSHVLEHTMNPGIALKNVWRVLKPNGWFFIIVPPYKTKVVGGHVMTGWNMGQLIYVLLINNFNVREGHFVKLKNNICAFVRKANFNLPVLHYDVGDIEALSNYWPIPAFQGFEGDIDIINWPPARKTNL